MWLRLDLDGIILELRITDYRETTDEDWCEAWAQTEISLTSQPWLNFHDEGEILLSSEIDELELMLDKLLKDQIENAEEIGFIEPDFKFVFCPKKDLRQDSKYLYVRPGFEIMDISVDWKVFFWNDGLTENFLSMNLTRNDIEDLLMYLKVVKGILTEETPEVQSRIQRQIFNPRYEK